MAATIVALRPSELSWCGFLQRTATHGATTMECREAVVAAIAAAVGEGSAAFAKNAVDVLASNRPVVDIDRAWMDGKASRSKAVSTNIAVFDVSGPSVADSATSVFVELVLPKPSKDGAVPVNRAVANAAKGRPPGPISAAASDTGTILIVPNAAAWAGLPRTPPPITRETIFLDSPVGTAQDPEVRIRIGQRVTVCRPKAPAFSGVVVQCGDGQEKLTVRSASDSHTVEVESKHVSAHASTSVERRHLAGIGAGAQRALDVLGLCMTKHRPEPPGAGRPRCLPDVGRKTTIEYGSKIRDFLAILAFAARARDGTEGFLARHCERGAAELRGAGLPRTIPVGKLASVEEMLPKKYRQGGATHEEQRKAHAACASASMDIDRRLYWSAHLMAMADAVASTALNNIFGDTPEEGGVTGGLGTNTELCLAKGMKAPGSLRVSYVCNSKGAVRMKDWCTGKGTLCVISKYRVNADADALSRGVDRGGCLAVVLGVYGKVIRVSADVEHNATYSVWLVESCFQTAVHLAGFAEAVSALNTADVPRMQDTLDFIVDPEFCFWGPLFANQQATVRLQTSSGIAGSGKTWAWALGFILSLSSAALKAWRGRVIMLMQPTRHRRDGLAAEVANAVQGRTDVRVLLCGTRDLPNEPTYVFEHLHSSGTPIEHAEQREALRKGIASQEIVREVMTRFLEEAKERGRKVRANAVESLLFCPRALTIIICTSGAAALLPQQYSRLSGQPELGEKLATSTVLTGTDETQQYSRCGMAARGFTPDAKLAPLVPPEHHFEVRSVRAGYRRECNAAGHLTTDLQTWETAYELRVPNEDQAPRTGDWLRAGPWRHGAGQLARWVPPVGSQVCVKTSAGVRRGRVASYSRAGRVVEGAPGSLDGLTVSVFRPHDGLTVSVRLDDIHAVEPRHQNEVVTEVTKTGNTYTVKAVPVLAQETAAALASSTAKIELKPNGGCGFTVACAGRVEVYMGDGAQCTAAAQALGGAPVPASDESTHAFARRLFAGFLRGVGGQPESLPDTVEARMGEVDQLQAAISDRKDWSPMHWLQDSQKAAAWSMSEGCSSDSPFDALRNGGCRGEEPAVRHALDCWLQTVACEHQNLSGRMRDVGLYGILAPVVLSRMGLHCFNVPPQPSPRVLTPNADRWPPILVAHPVPGEEDRLAGIREASREWLGYLPRRKPGYGDPRDDTTAALAVEAARERLDALRRDALESEAAAGFGCPVVRERARAALDDGTAVGIGFTHKSMADAAKHYCWDRERELWYANEEAAKDYRALRGTCGTANTNIGSTYLVYVVSTLYGTETPWSWCEPGLLVHDSRAQLQLVKLATKPLGSECGHLVAPGCFEDPYWRHSIPME